MSNRSATDTSAKLTEDEVYERVIGYEDADATPVLRQFGDVLLAANRERTKALETKATGDHRICPGRLGVLDVS